MEILSELIVLVTPWIRYRCYRLQHWKQNRSTAQTPRRDS